MEPEFLNAAMINTSADLVAAVSAAGSLGVLGCLDRPPGEAVAEIRRIRALTDRPFGVNFVLHRLDEETFAACLAERVPVFSFFRGDPADAVARAHAAGAVTIHQVTTVAEAARACAVGVDVLMGTRFLATPEAPIHPAYKQAIVDAAPGATVASPIFDIIWGEEWPGVHARGLPNQLTATW